MSRKNVANSRMTTEETVDAIPNTETSPEGSAETAEKPALPPDSVVTQEEFDRLKTERDSLIDRLARVQAEFDNVRKREARERAEFRDYAVANAVEQFLPVLDNFQLALKSNGTVEQLRAGVKRALLHVLRDGPRPPPRHRHPVPADGFRAPRGSTYA